MKDKNISNKQAKYTLRIDAQLLRALRYIAEYEGRSAMQISDKRSPFLASAV